jgi:hypothetical protein
VHTVDIFRIQMDGEPVWLDSAVSLEEGRAKISELMASVPGEYFLFCQRTQEKILITSNNETKG